VLYKAEVQGKPVACVCLVQEPGKTMAHFGLLAVAGRQSGLGKRLVAYIEDIARSAGATVMELSVVNIRPQWLSEWYGKRFHLGC
jgi:N-acetylglutamate synthase-like GNAT family acetyltransferase